MADPGAPDLAAFAGGVELGLYVAFVAIAGLVVLATIRRLLGV